jgi:hypothetical protein
MDYLFVHPDSFTDRARGFIRTVGLIFILSALHQCCAIARGRHPIFYFDKHMALYCPDVFVYNCIRMQAGPLLCACLET